MKKRLDARLGIIFISLALILSILALILLNGSTAWFAENNDIVANNASINVNSPGKLIESVEYYPISSISLSGNNNIYTFSASQIPKDQPKMLGTFSALVANRQLLIKINLKAGVTGARVIAQSSGDTYIVKNKDTVINKNGNPLSSVVEFYSIANVDKNEDGEYVISGSDIKGSVKRFSDIDSSYGVIPASFSPEIEVYSTPNGNTDNSIFIIVDYYEESLEYVLDFVSGLIADQKTDVVAGATVNFVCDFELSVVAR